MVGYEEGRNEGCPVGALVGLVGVVVGMEDGNPEG